MKYDEVYQKDDADGWGKERELRCDFEFSCEERVDPSLEYETPSSIHRRKGEVAS